jgi:hypothetical protein
MLPGGTPASLWMDGSAVVMSRPGFCVARCRNGATGNRRFFPPQQQTIGETAIRTNFLADLYVALGASDTAGDWTARVYWSR